MTKTYEKPPGEPPKPDEQCPLCKALPMMPHKHSCPWQKWAEKRPA